MRNRRAGRIPGGMFTAFGLSLAQLVDPRIVRVLAKSLAVTLAIFGMLGAGVWWLTELALAQWSAAHAAGLAAALALFVTLLALWLLFRAVAIAVVGIFADEVVQAVEARHYPAALANARPVALHRAALMGLGSAARFLGTNLLLVPVYIALLATGIGTAALFFAVNGWLLGRDLADMVTARHLAPAAMREWRATNRATRFLLGLAVTGLFVVPLVNILAPVLGAAMATHIFHRKRA